MSKIRDLKTLFANRKKSQDSSSGSYPLETIEDHSVLQQHKASAVDAQHRALSETHGLSKRKIADAEENTHHCDQKPPLDSTDTAEDAFTADTAPDGGFQAWLVVFGSFCGLTVIFGIMDSIGAIETYLSKNQLSSVSASTIGWIFSIFVIIGFGWIFITGHIFDKIGAKIPMIVGTALMFLGLMATANCTTVWQFILAFSVASGLACALMLAPLVGVVPQYFEKRMGLASAITSMGGSVGGTVFPVMLRRLYTKLGFVWAMRIFAFLNLGLLIIACLLVTARIQPVVSDSYKQKSMAGKLADCLVKSLDFRAFYELQFCLVTVATLFSEAAIDIVITYFASYAVAKGASLNTAYFLITLINLVGIPSRWATGMLADRYGKFNIMIIMVFGMGIVLLVILLPFGQHVGALYAFAVCFGIVSCSVFTLTPVCLAQITRVDTFGKRYGTMYVVATLGNLLIPAAGAITSRNSSQSGYNGYVIFAGVVCLTGGTFWLVARYVKVKARLVIY